MVGGAQDLRYALEQFQDPCGGVLDPWEGSHKRRRPCLDHQGSLVASFRDLPCDALASGPFPGVLGPFQDLPGVLGPFRDLPGVPGPFQVPLDDVEPSWKGERGVEGEASSGRGALGACRDPWRGGRGRGQGGTACTSCFLRGAGPWGKEGAVPAGGVVGRHVACREGHPPSFLVQGGPSSPEL